LSTSCQSFIVAAASSGYKQPQLKFTNAASAGGDNLFYCAGPGGEQDAGGGVISFCDKATAGSASFKVWTGAAAPPEHSTVGGEVSFSDATSAGSARFIIYDTLGSDGDTFGNTVFHDTATADNATFTNVGGTVSDGDGGKIVFYDDASGGTAKVELFGNGELNIGDHCNGITIGSLCLSGGIISTQLGSNLTPLTVSGELSLDSTHASFSFWKNDQAGFAFDTPYTILTNANLSRFTSGQFSGNGIEGVAPSFTIVGDDLQVSFCRREQT